MRGEGDLHVDFQELKAYIEPFFTEVRTTLKGVSDTIKEIKEDIHELDSDLGQLKERNAVQDHRLDSLESSQEKHETDHANGKKFNIEMWLLVGLFLADLIYNILRGT